MGGPFSGEVAEYYAQFRRGYPQELIDVIVDRFGLTPSDSVLDLGCGTAS